MQYDVIKPFNTATRRLIPGDGPAGVVDDSDDFSPNTKDVLLERKFIQPKSMKPAAAPIAALSPAAPKTTFAETGEK
jgi:hypothetical protein